jgi:hypothetical protein
LLVVQDPQRSYGKILQYKRGERHDDEARTDLKDPIALQRRAAPMQKTGLLIIVIFMVLAASVPDHTL